MGKKSAASQRSIYACLQKFDVEDVNLQKSMTGGWHGTYMNKLAHGVNEADDDNRYRDREVGGLPDYYYSPSSSYEKDPFAATTGSGGGGGRGTHSSIASDSLFVDDAMNSPPPALE